MTCGWVLRGRPLPSSFANNDSRTLAPAVNTVAHQCTFQILASVILLPSKPRSTTDCRTQTRSLLLLKYLCSFINTDNGSSNINMRPPSVHIVVAVTSTTLFSATNAQACAPGSGTGTAQEINGNWYCSEVSAITYENFPGHGYYNQVTNMDADTGQCSSRTHAYSGSLSPLNEEVSLADVRSIQ